VLAESDGEVNIRIVEKRERIGFRFCNGIDGPDLVDFRAVAIDIKCAPGGFVVLICHQDRVIDIAGNEVVRVRIVRKPVRAIVDRYRQSLGDAGSQNADTHRQIVQARDFGRPLRLQVVTVLGDERPFVIA